MPKVEIDSERCKGCEYCVIACPKKVLAIGDKLNSHGIRYAVVVKPDACIGCSLCAQICPDVCIEVWR